MSILILPAPPASQCAACNAQNWRSLDPATTERPIYTLEITTPPGGWRSSVRLCESCLSTIHRLTLDHDLAVRGTQSTTGLIRRLLGALRPFAQFARQFRAKPLRGQGDTVYAIHTGTEWEAEITLADLDQAWRLEAAAELDQGGGQ